MKPVKPIHTDDISGMNISILGKIIDQASEDDVSDVKKDVFWIFRGMKR